MICASKIECIVCSLSVIVCLSIAIIIVCASLIFGIICEGFSDKIVAKLCNKKGYNQNGLKHDQIVNDNQ